MHKLTTGFKACLSAFILTFSVPASLVYAQEEEVTNEEEEAYEEAIDELAIPAMQPYNAADIPEELIVDRMKCLEKDIKLTYNDKVKGFIDYFTIKNKRYLQVMESRRNVYFPIFEEYLKKHNMPDELKYLSIVESGLNPKAISRAGAAGLWQFMPSTGKIYHLNQNFYIDERQDPYEATEAACQYLKQLYNMFDDWELALASYNCGPGNVRKAIRKSGYKETFWEVYRYLPQETRSYVPQFVAITYVMNYLEEYQIPSDSLEYLMTSDTIILNQTISLEKFCEGLNVCKEDVEKLNPGLKRDIIPGDLKYPLRIPSDVLEAFKINRVAILDSAKISEEARVAYEEEFQPAKVYYKVKRGDYLGKIADKYNVSVSELKKWNRLRGSTVHIGQNLTIYTKQKVSIPSSATVAKNSNNSQATAKKKPETRIENSYYTVRSGDNLNKIAGKYDVTVTDLKNWNGISGSVIKVGQKLVVKKTTRAVAEGRVAERTADPKVYYVQPGDTLWSISRKFNGVSIQDIKKKNNLKDENIKPGMKLIIG